MKKLSKEELDNIASEVFNEIYPNHEEHEEGIKEDLLNIIFTAMTKFMEKYQEEVEK